MLESIKMSWENVIHNKLRSFLTMLGIVIGIASIITLITLVQGATNSINGQISTLGVNKVMITAAGTPLKQGLSGQDLQNITGDENIKGISPTVSVKMNVAYNGTVMEDVTIQGKNQVYFSSDQSLVKAGRAINILDVESKNQVALIGHDIAQQLFYGKNPIGMQMTINGMHYTIIGLLDTTSGFSMSSNNQVVVVPYTTAMRSLGIKNIMSLDVYVSDTSKSGDTITAIKGVLNPAFNYRSNAFTIFNMEDMISSFQQMMSMMSLLLAGIAAISLVVGGIGIMNMMLVSVTERTREIGLRKALGATPGRIQLQFIIESIFLALFGGIIGLLLGLLLAWGASSLIGISFSLSVSTMALAVGFSSAVGVVFGLMPARKASRLNPIDALRHE